MWDIALDPETGDFMFGPSHDLIGVSGTALDKQRILNRCKIPRGTYTYDVTGTLGSRLHLISSSPLERQFREAPALVEEALEPMTDIRVGTVTPSINENRLLLDVEYSTVVQTEEGDSVVPENTPTYDARVTI